jgi:hypothetical protein
VYIKYYPSPRADCPFSIPSLNAEKNAKYEIR